MVHDKTACIFSGCIPALMTPCTNKGDVDLEALVKTAAALIGAGMRAVVYCGSMGDWPLIDHSVRKSAVEALISANIPTIVGTGAQSPVLAADLASHAAKVGADGLMVIPRVLSRGLSVAAQKAHFASILGAAAETPAVIYNSPYYGFETRAELFFRLRAEHSNLVGFKEFGGSASLTYAAEHITSGDPALSLMVGVDTQVVHGFINCGARGAITGVGNALPIEVLRLVTLAQRAAAGDAKATMLARELDNAMSVLSKFDEGTDLVLYYKHLMVLEGAHEYECNINPADRLTETQRSFLESQWQQFRAWWSSWPGRTD